MACSYLTQRKITVNYARETVTKSTNKGCVQGSICGPTFWNIIIDSLLQRLTDAKVHCQAFADDVVLAFSSESSSTIENAANEAQAMVLTKKLKFQNPTIQMAGSQINLVEEIKVLGLIIDTRLNFRSHVAAVCKSLSKSTSY
ncbi:Putative 115 kDa protein in type-1 retrotransposable element R1DM [Eumeta japonica]|uniref:115 kDa protein in type-1 retrotransposable element R1DM n=1 Tax=Eumeta variegata TaxID=151549 RepID=A0A4C1Z8D2_EUMVA|nr:Putative 115 kDa protein in type-1 retrotransposable element R1DM [Eumeta japonica]